MIRFCEIDDEEIYNEEYLILDENIWKNGRKFFAEHKNAEKVMVLDRSGKPLCYAFQDKEANREIRMLRELEAESKALGFKDIFPEYKSVVIYGCNELAYYFACYLKKQNVDVKVEGNYWNDIGVENKDYFAGKKLYIYAEGTWQHETDLKRELLRSVSVEFECIDQIYLKNAAEGIIQIVLGSMGDLIEKIKSKKIILLGVRDNVQDVYDILLSWHCDITAFLLDKGEKRNVKFFGKEIIDTDEIQKYENVVFIECIEKNSILGEGKLDEFVYFGCRRNENFYFIRDYIDIPRTNLIHVMQDKNLVLAGDQYMCSRLKRFLIKNGKKDVEINYYTDTNYENIENVLGIIVVPQVLGMDNNYKIWREEIEFYIEKFRKSKIVNYTEYFCKMISFIKMDLETEKYPHKELRPKGILLGAINANSGNIFFRDCIDNHPNIIQLGLTQFEINLFYYCIKLTEVKICNLISEFWKLLKKDITTEVLEEEFPSKDCFNLVCVDLLKDKTYITSQELFVIFAKAYNCMRGRETIELSETIIYWEPHNHPRSVVCSYAGWLMDKQISGNTVWVARNNLIRAGSLISYGMKKFDRSLWYEIIKIAVLEPEMEEETFAFWKSIYVKFEDLKLHPKESFKIICDAIGIVWSDTLLETTRWGEKSSYMDGTTGYDLKPVYNDYSEWLSVYDKLRVSIASSHYQNVWGYPYEDCLKFTRRELQEMFLKGFLAESKMESAEQLERDKSTVQEAMQKFIRGMYYQAYYNQLQK